MCAASVGAARGVTRIFVTGLPFRRWRCSLRHDKAAWFYFDDFLFVEDTGAPPHAAIVGGDLHGKTETFANPEKLQITGYRPRSLGRTGDEAVAGLQQRMAGLIEFSKDWKGSVPVFPRLGKSHEVSAHKISPCDGATNDRSHLAQLVARPSGRSSRLMPYPSSFRKRRRGFLLASDGQSFIFCAAFCGAVAKW